MDRQGWQGRSRRALAVVVVAGAIVFAPAAARADERSFWETVGVGVGAGALNVLYFPAKLVYATSGALVGGVAWLVTLGDIDAAQSVWGSTLGGTWAITPSMIEGRDPVEFNGRVPLHVGPSTGSEAAAATPDPLDPTDPYAGSENWR